MTAHSHLRLVPTPGPSSDPPPVETRARELSEADLVAGLVTRDPSVCDRVYRLYQRPVLYMLRRVLGNDPELADLHHEVFVQALQSARRFRGDCRLETWLIAIAVNCARAKLRSRARKRWLTFMAPEDLPEHSSSSGEAASQARAVYALLSQLPTEERIAFTLRYVEGMTQLEAAAAMGCSTGTVKRRLRRARDRFDRLARRHPALRGLVESEASS